MRQGQKYTTLNLHEAAWFRMQGHGYDLEENARGRGMFVFANSDELYEEREAFLKGQSCNIQDYVTALKIVKTDLYGFMETRRGR